MLAGRRQARGVELHEARVGEGGAAPVRPPDRGGVRGLGVGRQEVDVGVAAGREHHGVAQVHLERAAETRSRATTPRARPSTTIRSSTSRRGSRATAACRDLLAAAPDRRRAGAAGRFARARRTCATRAPRRTSGWRAARRTRGRTERPAPRLVDDARRQLGQPVHVRLARAEVAALAACRGTVARRCRRRLVVLGRVDPALRGHAVGTPRRVVEGEAAHAVAELAQRRRRRGAGQPRAHDDHLVLPPPRRADQRRARCDGVASAPASGPIGVRCRAESSLARSSHDHPRARRAVPPRSRARAPPRPRPPSGAGAAPPPRDGARGERGAPTGRAAGATRAAARRRRRRPQSAAERSPRTRLSYTCPGTKCGCSTPIVRCSRCKTTNASRSAPPIAYRARPRRRSVGHGSAA